MALDNVGSTDTGTSPSPAAWSSKPIPPPKPQRKKQKPALTTLLVSADAQQAPLLQEQTLEELEKGETLRSPFTSTTGSGSMEGHPHLIWSPSRGSQQPSSSSLLDAIPLHVAIALPSPLLKAAAAAAAGRSGNRMQELSPMALAQDGFLTLPDSPEEKEASSSSLSSTSSTASTTPPLGEAPSSNNKNDVDDDDNLLCLVSPPPLTTPTTTSATTNPSSSVQSIQRQRRLSLPGLALRSTPRSGSSTSGFATLDSLRAKLAGGGGSKTTTPRATATAPTSITTTQPVVPATSSATPELDDHDGLLIQSARRLGLDITGLRRALLVRILGIELVAPAPSTSSSPAVKAAKRNRSASTGVMPVAWLNNRGSGSSGTTETYEIVVWLYDMESGQEWRVRKGPMEFVALHEVVSAFCPGGMWVERGHFPLRRHKSETSAPNVEKQAKLERYLRRLAGAMELSPRGNCISLNSNHDVAKTLQDWVGATERIDELERYSHTAARGDLRRHLRQQLQVQVVEIIRRGGGWQEKLQAFVEEANKCDVQKTDLLKAYGLFLGRTAREMVEAPAHKEALVGLARLSLASPPLVSGSGEIDEAEVEQFCVSAVRRVLEAETFLPLRLRLYDRVTLETDMEQEKQLARKCAVFQTRPQSFFGIPVDHISVSSWETAVEHLRRLSGDVTTLPSDKLDALVAAVREVHACYRREHGESGGGGDGVGLSADDFLPIFIYVVSQCCISRLLSLKNMLGALADPARMMSEAGYCLASLEGSIEYLLQLDETADEI